MRKKACSKSEPSPTGNKTIPRRSGERPYPSAYALTLQNSTTVVKKFPKCPGYPDKIELHSHFLTSMLWGSWLSPFATIHKMRSTLAGTQIGVPICFTEYPQPSSLAAELWTPCCPLLLLSDQNPQLRIRLYAHTHTRKSRPHPAHPVPLQHRARKTSALETEPVPAPNSYMNPNSLLQTPHPPCAEPDAKKDETGTKTLPSALN